MYGNQNTMSALAGGAGFAAGYAVAQMPPLHDRTTGKASVLVITCIDPRYTNDAAWFLSHNASLHADYDLVTFAGAELGILTKPNWRVMFMEHIELAKKLHNIKGVWCISHLDCGMYKATLDMATDDDGAVHINKMKELRVELAMTHSDLTFRGFLISVKGELKEVLLD